MSAFYRLSQSDPWVVGGFLLSLLVCAGAVALRARVKVTHRQTPPTPQTAKERRRLHAIVEITNRRAS